MSLNTKRSGVYRGKLEKYMDSQAKNELKILRRKQVEGKTGLSRSNIYSRLRFNPKRPKEFDPTFPKPIDLGERAVGWVESEIDDWINARFQQSRAG